jgi:hypothetical protein
LRSDVVQTQFFREPTQRGLPEALFKKAFNEWDSAGAFTRIRRQSSRRASLLAFFRLDGEIDRLRERILGH